MAVIDTGVDYTDADLAANIWTNPDVAGNGTTDGFTGDVHGYNFVADNGNPMDDNGHGTHVAGILGAVGNNGLGITGVDWSVSIMALKFLDADGTGNLSDAISAINYATMMRTRYGVNVRVDNCSWGGGTFSAALQTAIQAANDAGILVVTAAGNNGTNNDAVAEYPANVNSPNVISVAALDPQRPACQLQRLRGHDGRYRRARRVDPQHRARQLVRRLFRHEHGRPGGRPAWRRWPGRSTRTPRWPPVRNAILQGADQSAALKGKVACGGSLDAYKTLELLGGQPLWARPSAR